MQVRQQEHDIRALRQQNQVPTPTKSPMSEGPGADVESIKRAIAAKSEEIVRMEAALQRERGQSLASTGAAEQALVQLRAENKRLGDTLSQETVKYDDLKKRLQQMSDDWNETRQRMQQALQSEIEAANKAHLQGSSGLDAENARLRQELDALDQRDQQAQQTLRQAQQVVEEVTRTNETNLKLLQELVPCVDSMFSQGTPTDNCQMHTSVPCVHRALLFCACCSAGLRVKASAPSLTLPVQYVLMHGARLIRRLQFSSPTALTRPATRCLGTRRVESRLAACPVCNSFVARRQFSGVKFVRRPVARACERTLERRSRRVDAERL